MAEPGPARQGSRSPDGDAPGTHSFVHSFNLPSHVSLGCRLSHETRRRPFQEPDVKFVQMLFRFTSQQKLKITDSKARVAAGHHRCRMVCAKSSSVDRYWGCSSHGRALRSHRRGSGIDTRHLQTFIFSSLSASCGKLLLHGPLWARITASAYTLILEGGQVGFISLNTKPSVHEKYAKPSVHCSFGKMRNLKPGVC